MKEEFKDKDQQELQDLLHLKSQEEWATYVNLLKERARYHQNQVNSNIRNGNFHEAVRSQAKLEDIQWYTKIMMERIRSLNKKLEGKEDN